MNTEKIQKTITYKLILAILLFSTFSCGNSNEIPEEIQKKLFEANQAFLDQKFDSAIEITNSIAKRYPKYSANLILRGKTLFYTKKFNEAEKDFEKILDSHPENQEALIWMGRINALYDKTLPEAETIFKKALANNPSNYQVHLMLANVYQRKGNIKQALIHYQYSLQSEYDLLTTYREYEKLLKSAKLTDRENIIRKKRETLEKMLK